MVGVSILQDYFTLCSSYVLGNYALYSLQVRGVSGIQRFLVYTSNGSSIGT